MSEFVDKVDGGLAGADCAGQAAPGENVEELCRCSAGAAEPHGETVGPSSPRAGAEKDTLFLEEENNQEVKQEEEDEEKNEDVNRPTIPPHKRRSFGNSKKISSRFARRNRSLHSSTHTTSGFTSRITSRKKVSDSRAAAMEVARLEDTWWEELVEPAPVGMFA